MPKKSIQNQTIKREYRLGKYLEETIIIVSIGWIVIYLYGEYKLESVTYNHWLILIPVLLFLYLVFICFIKKIKNDNGLF